tara:strand:- start:26647 stop:26979 length:333 start_codon:yes stop_codon:yes gene_type:complete
MAMGSYDIGMTVKIPFQISDGGIPITDIVPKIDKIVTPSGKTVPGFPANMKATDASKGTYQYKYKPREIGDYIVIISIDIDGNNYVSLENFTVKSNNSAGVIAVPRAEHR